MTGSSEHITPRSLVWVTSGFAPYRVPIWNELNKLMRCEILLLSEQERVREWHLESKKIEPQLKILKGKHFYNARMDWGFNLSFFSVHRELDRIAPDVVIIGGYESPGFWAALLWAKRRKRPVVMHYGSTNLSTRTPHNLILNFAKGLFIRSCDAYFSYGRLAKEQLVLLGANKDAVIAGENMSDTALTPDASRTEGPSPSLLYAGQLIPRKGTVEMLSALAMIKELRWECTLAGNGAQLETLQAMARDAGISDRVHFKGFLPESELAKEYHNHDFLIFPSLREVWGLVVNEALLSGLFVIGSDRAASCVELIQENVNGTVVCPEPQQIAAALRKALSAPLPDRARIRASVTHITPASQAQKIHDAIEIAMKRSR